MFYEKADDKYKAYKSAVQCGDSEFYDVFEYCGDAAKLGNLDALLLIGDYLGYNKYKEIKPLKIYIFDYMQDVVKVLPEAGFYLHLMFEQNSYSHILEKHLSKTSDTIKQLSKMYLISSAKSGFPIAMDVLGGYLINGYLFPKNEQDGLSWLMKAIEKNYAPAMSSLGFYYASKSEPSNKIKATYWFARAALLGDKYGIDMLSYAFRDGNGVKKNKQMQSYLEKLNSPYYKNESLCKPKCFEEEMNKILQLNIIN